MRLTKDEYFTTMAALVASRSTCKRRAVGCVLINARGHVLSTGYNGVPTGFAHCNAEERYETPTPRGVELRSYYPHACNGVAAASGTQLDACQAVHAEQNALLQCHDVWSIDTCYTTTLPCITCTKLLLNTSCRRIVFVDRYPHPEAERLWLSAGREYLQVKSPL